MRGWLVSSAFVTDDEYLDLLSDFETAATSLGVCLERLTNMDVAPLLGHPEPLSERPDFCLFWCKDLQLARHLEAAGVRLFNRAEALAASDDKATTAAVLMKNNICQPRTVVVPRTDATTRWDPTAFSRATVRALGLPVVVKGTRGSFGQEVFLASSIEELADLLKNLSGKPCICQTFVSESFGRDLRIQVVGGRVVGTILRHSETGDFRANISVGGSFETHSATDAEARIAVAATRALGLDFAGVDLLFGPDGKPVVCEVNANAHSIPEMREALGVDVATEILQHIITTVEGGTS